MYREEEDGVTQTKSKNDKFFVKALYSALELGNSIYFPTCVI